MGGQEVAPEYQSIFDQSTCTRRGMCPVTRIHHRREPLESHSLYFEVHGSGPQKIVFIMGLNDSSFAWLPQVDHFSKLEQYSTLVFDNRGVGQSGSPWGLYSTDGMAEDLICLLDYLHWTGDRSLHIVGISMGGMIAQKLAYRIPSRILSLSLIVTRAGKNIWLNGPSPNGVLHFIRLLVAKVPDRRAPIMLEMSFPNTWLDSLAENDLEGRTNREVQSQNFCRKLVMTKPQTVVGAVGQMAAALTHSMTPARLATISTSVTKVLILSAAEDAIIPYREGENLKRHMPDAEYQCWEGTGHMVCIQHRDRFNRLLQKVFDEAKDAVANIDC